MLVVEEEGGRVAFEVSRANTLIPDSTQQKKANIFSILTPTQGLGVSCEVRLHSTSCT